MLEENIGENLHDIDLGNGVLDMIPKAQATKAKIDKWEGKLGKALFGDRLGHSLVWEALFRGLQEIIGVYFFFF